jgi:hypothetical protein
MPISSNYESTFKSFNVDASISNNDGVNKKDTSSLPDESSFYFSNRSLISPIFLFDVDARDGIFVLISAVLGVDTSL